MQRLVACVIVSVLLLSGPLSASVMTYTGTEITNEIGKATFDSVDGNTDLSTYSEAGLSVTVNDSGFIYGVFYPNGGAREPYVIKRLDGNDFQALEMDTNTGWGGAVTRYWWVQAYLDGSLVGQFDLDIPDVSPWPRLGIKGQFDEVRIGAFFDANQRDAHDWSSYTNAGELDNMSYGTIQPVPVPGAIMLGMIGLALIRPIRRRVA